ncbi:MAG: DUF58 domain-containing protein [Pseudomonadota bacterium]
MDAQDERVPSLFSVPLILFFVGVFLFIALLNGQRDLALWAILVMGVAGGAKVWGLLSLSGLTCHSSVDRVRVFPGEILSLKIIAENAKFLPVWLRLSLPAGEAIVPASAEQPFTRESGLLWYQSVRFLWQLKALRRGVHQLGPPRIIVGDLLGFFPREKAEAKALDIIVYPRLLPLKSFSLPRRDLFGSPGAKSPVQDPVYILGTRDYQYSQPARYIHWKASARHNRLQEKVFEPSSQAKALLVIDVGGFAAHKAEAAFERTLETAASLALRMEQEGYALGLSTNAVLTGGGSAVLPINRSSRQLSDILERLARMKMEPQVGIEDLFQRGLRVPPGVSALHFSYDADGSVLAAEKYFSFRKIPAAFIVAVSPSLPGEHGGRFGRRITPLDELILEGDKGP